MRNESCHESIFLAKRLLCAAFALAVTLLACLILPPRFSAEAAGGNLVTIEDSVTPLAESSSKVLKPEASGKTTHSGGGATVDVSNASEGYIMVKFSGSTKRIKLQLTKTGKNTYRFDIPTDGKYVTLPLTAGDGKYKIEVFEQISGNQYAQAMSCSVDVKLRNAMLPFLYPNQYVSFNKDSATVKKSNELAKGASNTLDVVDKVYNYVISNVKYDNNKAAQVTAGKMNGYLSNVDTTLSTNKGICFDFASITCAMLRAQGIPARMEFGYVSNGAYHAWLSTYVKDVGVINTVIKFDGKSWVLMDPTFASGGNSKYVGSGSGYKTSLIY